MRADPVRSRNSHQKTQTDGRNAQRAVRSHSHIGLSEPKRELLTYYFVATAYDTMGTETGFSSPALVVRRPDSGDTTPPTVSITAPVNNTSVTKKSTVTISATASDNVGVTTVAFFVNGTLTCSDTTRPYTCAWKVPAAPNLTY